MTTVELKENFKEMEKEFGVSIEFSSTAQWGQKFPRAKVDKGNGVSFTRTEPTHRELVNAVREELALNG